MEKPYFISTMTCKCAHFKGGGGNQKILNVRKQGNISSVVFINKYQKSVKTHVE